MDHIRTALRNEFRVVGDHIDGPAPCKSRRRDPAVSFICRRSRPLIFRFGDDSKKAPHIREAFEIDLKEFPETYCPDGKTFLSSCEKTIEDHFQVLWSLHRDASSYALLKRRFETLALLGHMLSKDPKASAKPCTFLTAAPSVSIYSLFPGHGPAASISIPALRA